MKLGLILSVILVAFVALFFFLVTSSPADSPTNATSAERLVKSDTLANLPAVFTPDQPEASANEHYRNALDLYKQQERAFANEMVAQGLADRLIGHLVAGMRAGQVSRPFIDDMIPTRRGATPDFGDALEMIPFVVIQRAQSAIDARDEAYALQSLQALWAFGQRLYQESVRFHNRHQGLMIMNMAGTELYKLKHLDPALEPALTRWGPEVQKITAAWQPKMETIFVVRPHMGNLINIARNDQDPTFRVEAILALGPKKFSAGSRGNERAIEEVLEAAKGDANALVVEAGAASAAFTRDDLRRLH